MGQKTNPIGLRLGIIKSWESRWFSEKNYSELLQEDINLRRFLMKRLSSAGISKIVIERPAKLANITLYSSRPGVIIGKKGSDIEKLKKLNLGKGGSLENAVVIKDNKILNDGGLRNDLEFVNHKILDCMGDLFLSGYKIIGSLKCSQGGHNLTNQLLRKVFSDQNNYSLIEIKGKQLPHTFANYHNLKSIA